MSEPNTPEVREAHRAQWAKIGIENGWHNEEDFLPIQFFINRAGEIVDSVSFRTLTEDIEYVTDAYDE